MAWLPPLVFRAACVATPTLLASVFTTDETNQGAVNPLVPFQRTARPAEALAHLGEMPRWVIVDPHVPAMLRRMDQRGRKLWSL